MSIKTAIKRIIPPVLLNAYHYGLALLGAVVFGFPGSKLIVIGVTGTSGKSTTVDFITRILEEAGHKTASMSSVRFKIGQEEKKNTLKMTMPGRFKVQQFLRQAVKEGCKYAVLEVTSEGIKQSRHRFINFTTAVFTNLSPEHIESHGGFENYRNEKLKLFKATKNTHIINIDDPNAEHFLKIPATQKYFFTAKEHLNLEFKHEDKNTLEAREINIEEGRLGFSVSGTHFNLNLLGNFNMYNALAAIGVGVSEGISLEVCKNALGKAKSIPGRMEIVAKSPLVVVDYAHTPEQLELAYKSLAPKPLVCVLGSCGGGRDKWKRPVLGKIARQYCKEIIITNEDPYDEDPLEIMEQVADGIEGKSHSIVMDRKEAIKKALELAKPKDAVIITGKGSEMWMCLESGQKIPWDDRQIVRDVMAGTPKA
ncbi:MAG: UDP-N-acetylmuramoyl-L-alanyl-D-glutamate--2,6-diaminopimelate ligase [bacterium]|nr:UDP-N-acetylmuramoyl-L-alanyl-D-glutamate--2,6-diaminopimelate ligase [bacterium]